MNTSRSAILIAVGVCSLIENPARADDTGFYAAHEESQGAQLGSSDAGLVYVPATLSAGMQDAAPAGEPPTGAGRVVGGEAVTKDELDTSPAGIKYGTEGTTWWSITAGIGADFIDSTDYNIAGSITHFVVNDFEVGGELGLWYHNQPDPSDDVGSANLVLVFRWHFLNRDTWTIFADAGIGVYFASDELPEGGTEFGFTPRIGVGFTHRLGDSQNRVIAGVRWAHFSNARISGDDDNPGIDDAFFYGGVVFPF